jgi:hypothetical protein
MHNVGTFQNITDTNTFPLNKWTHVAVTYNLATTTMTLYVNGIQVAQSTVMPALPEYSMRIGQYGTGSGWVGRISDVRVWNYARPVDVILRDMDKELTGYEKGLIGYWKLNDGAGNVALDYSSTGNDGAITSGTWADGRIVAPILPVGKFGGAVAIDYPTTNLFPNPSFDTGTLTPWIYRTTGGGTGAPTGVQTTGVMRNDTGWMAWIKAETATGTGDLHNYSVEQTISTTSTLAITLSALIKAPAGRLLAIRLTRTLGTGGTQWGSATDNIKTTLVSTGDWQRVSGTLAAYSGTDTVTGYTCRIGIETAGVTVGDMIYVDDAQLELQPYATAYTPITRTSPNLQYPIGDVNIKEGTISFWMKPLYYSTGGLVYLGIGGTRSMTAAEDQNSYNVYFNNTRITTTFGDGAATKGAQASWDPPIGQWLHYACTWKENGALIVYYNGSQVSTVTLGALNPVWIDPYIHIGSTRNGSNAACAYIEELRIEKVAVPADEIMSWYQSNAPFYNYLDYTGVDY